MSEAEPKMGEGGGSRSGVCTTFKYGVRKRGFEFEREDGRAIVVV